jgi:tetratricopeptide (TPR) repeat protein
LGNLLYDWQPEEAVKLWEQSAALDGSYAIVLRNLAIAYSHQKGADALQKAIAGMEKAVALKRKYPLHFAELDELYAAAGAPVEKRLAVLEKNQDIVAGGDDALSRLIALKLVAGKYDEAIRLLAERRFAVWEGGSLTVADSWTDAHLLRGQRLFADKRYREALADYETALKTPENLPSDRADSREAEVSYWIGCAHEALGGLDHAKAAWQKSASASMTDAPRPRRGGGSAQGYYQGMSLAKLGRADEAKKIFQAMVDSANESLKQASSTSASAPPSDGQPSRRSRRNQLAQSHYLAGLGYLGLNEKDKAQRELAQTLEVSPDHLGAKEAIARLAR